LHRLLPLFLPLTQVGVGFSLHNKIGASAPSALPKARCCFSTEN
jgi:hypothetical protein